MHTDQRGYIRVGRNGKEHRLIVEKVLGRKLKRREIVHHVDEDKQNNSNDNLLLCTQAYHLLIHQRINAKVTTGDPNKRKCVHCKSYDDLDNAMTVDSEGVVYHIKCRRDYGKMRYHKRKELHGNTQKK